MPYPRSHKPKSREKILQSAARLFSWYGFDQVSIDQVMEDAGLTRGAFYSHFSDKSALYAEAIIYAAKQSQLTKYKPDLTVDNGLQSLLEAYLSMKHVGEESFPCPLAFLVTDVSQRDPQVRTTYSRVYQGMVKKIGKLKEGTLDKDQRLALTAMMIGGVAIARALDNQKDKEELLSACRQHGLTLLGEGDSDEEGV